ncbi:MAG: ketopantoate reductase family protein [Hyphomicrobiaceae bacterium]
MSGKRIAVVGSGAVGGYLGAHMARAGLDVTMLDPWPEHVETMRTKGLSISGMSPEEAFTQKMNALHLTELQGIIKDQPIDIAIVAVKSYDTIWATQMIAPYLSPGGYVVSAQNCVNEERIASVVGWGKTVGCMVGNNYAVELYEPGAIRRTMPKDGKIPTLEAGEVHGRITPRIQELAEILSTIDKARATTNLWGVRWSKLCVNGMRNGVSAATGLGGNARDRHDRIRRVVVKLAGEAVKVGRAMGLDLEAIAKIDPDLWARASDNEPDAVKELDELIIASTSGAARSDLQRPSMAQDIAKGRRTEIDYMNGYIAEKGREAGIPAPTHAALTRIVRQVERGQLEAKPENLFNLTN